MTPLQLAHQFCANYQHNGSCSGIGIHNNGSLHTFGAKPKCSIQTERCPYFEQCVAPIASRCPGHPQEPSLQEAITSYRRQFPGTITTKDSTQCSDCGRQIQRPLRLCATCRKSHRKASLKAEKQRQRNITV